MDVILRFDTFVCKKHILVAQFIKKQYFCRVYQDGALSQTVWLKSIK